MPGNEVTHFESQNLGDRGRQSSELKATLGYRRLTQKQIQVVVIHTIRPDVWESHTFNPSIREVETGGGQREDYKWEETETHWSVESEDSWRQDLAPLV